MTIHTAMSRWKFLQPWHVNVHDVCDDHAKSADVLTYVRLNIDARTDPEGIGVVSIDHRAPFGGVRISSDAAKFPAYAEEKKHGAFFKC